jgi:hypothetical protein
MCDQHLDHALLLVGRRSSMPYSLKVIRLWEEARVDEADPLLSIALDVQDLSDEARPEENVRYRLRNMLGFLGSDLDLPVQLQILQQLERHQVDAHPQVGAQINMLSGRFEQALRYHRLAYEDRLQFEATSTDLTTEERMKLSRDLASASYVGGSDVVLVGVLGLGLGLGLGLRLGLAFDVVPVCVCVCVFFFSLSCSISDFLSVCECAHVCVCVYVCVFLLPSFLWFILSFFVCDCAFM